MILYIIIIFIIILLLLLLLLFISDKFYYIYHKCFRKIGYTFSDLIFLFLPKYNQILPNLFISEYSTAQNINFLEKEKIKLIINLSKDINFVNNDNIDKFRIPINDDRTIDSIKGMIEYFPIIYKKMDYYLTNNLPVLVHCRSGIQRSATLICLYIMHKYNTNFKQAKKIIRRKRPIVFLPFNNFKKCINYFDNKL